MVKTARYAVDLLRSSLGKMAPKNGSHLCFTDSCANSVGLALDQFLERWLGTPTDIDGMGGR